jgi:hypothetical protein
VVALVAAGCVLEADAWAVAPGVVSRSSVAGCMIHTTSYILRLHARTLRVIPNVCGVA